MQRYFYFWSLRMCWNLWKVWTPLEQISFLPRILPSIRRILYELYLVRNDSLSLSLAFDISGWPRFLVAGFNFRPSPSASTDQRHNAAPFSICWSFLRQVIKWKNIFIILVYKNWIKYILNKYNEAWWCHDRRSERRVL